jgi:hypothetical protein
MKEIELQSQICKFIRLQYPNTIFRSDFASGMRMSIGQAMRHKSLQSSRAFPDLFILEPKARSHGLFLEIKTSYDKVYKKDGLLRSSPHLTEQREMLDRLIILGYEAHFTFSLDHARFLIAKYMNRI